MVFRLELRLWLKRIKQFISARRCFWQVMEAEVVEFLVPVENTKTLFVWNLEETRSEDQLNRELWRTFSCFGPLYLLKLCPEAPGFFSALVKFFSCGHAARAQKATDGQTLFQSRPLKVRLGSKQTPHFLSRSAPLSHARCITLANHCLGFNGWTSDIITLKELEPEPDDDSDSRGRSLRLGCLLQLSFPSHHLTTRGTAVLQDSPSSSDPAEMLLLRSRLTRAVRERALVQAFSNVLLVLLDNGKVLLELKDSHQFVPEEEEEQVLQVTEVSLPPDEDEEEAWELTVS